MIFEYIYYINDSFLVVYEDVYLYIYIFRYLHANNVRTDHLETAGCAFLGNLANSKLRIREA